MRNWFAGLSLRLKLVLFNALLLALISSVLVSIGVVSARRGLEEVTRRIEPLCWVRCKAV